MLTLLLFAIPLSSYIVLSVVIMVLWLFFVMTKLQIDTAQDTGKRATRPEPTPFSFFKPGDNPTAVILPSTFSDQELAISVSIEKGKPTRVKQAVDPVKPVADNAAVEPVEPDTETNAQHTDPSDRRPSAGVSGNPSSLPATTPNPDFADRDDQIDFALYQPRQVSMVAALSTVGTVVEAEPDQLAEPSQEQIITLNDLQADVDAKMRSRKQKTDQLMKLAVGLDFDAYVNLFRTYYDQAITQQREHPDRAFYVVFGELIADENADVQAQLLILLDREVLDEEPESLRQVAVFTDDPVTEPAMV